MMRFWERAFRRAHLPLAMSQGFHPHPRISVAAPLPVGITSEGELMDAHLDEAVATEEALRRLRSQLTPGFEVLSAEPVPDDQASLQALVRFSEYVVDVETNLPAAEIERMVRRVLAKAELPWELTRDGEVRHYDLRSQIADLGLVNTGSGVATISMRLQTDGKASGRPEQVVRALGFEEPPLRIHRTRLVLEKPLPVPASVAAQRRSSGTDPQRR
jgi:radical SAM-linked protein